MTNCVSLPQLIIVVADRMGVEGTQTLQAMTTIVINVEDINDEEPYFTVCVSLTSKD